MKSRVLLALLFVLPLAFSVQTLNAQPRSQVVQETDDEYKVTTYKRFVDNWEANPGVAYQAAKDYMAKYNKEDDQYTRYLKAWIAEYEANEKAMRLAAERADREQQLLGSFTQKDFAKAYGLAKQVLTDKPDNLRVLIALGYGAFAASTESRNETFNADASKYAEKAVQLIESGKTPAVEGSASVWTPFKSREDVLGSLQYAMGFYALKPSPETAVTHFIKAAQVDEERGKAAATYYYLAASYQTGPYKRLSDDFSKRFANQPESPGSKAALENINKVVDKMIDAYARAVALAGPEQTNAKTQWMAQLTNFWKFRHENTDTGLTEYISGVLKTPLPV